MNRNGGHICARPQLIVTSKNWSQREAFLEQVKIALEESTYGVGSYYPGYEKRMQKFEQEHDSDKVQVLQPKNCDSCTQLLWIPGCSEDDYVCKNEAFCQVLAEVPLDTDADATSFLDYATQFCNEKVSGSLVAGIVIDGTTKRRHRSALHRAVNELNYGTIGINMQPAYSFGTPAVIFGGKDHSSTDIVSGKGHFGNQFGFQNAEKSILEDTFWSLNHVALDTKGGMNRTLFAMARYSSTKSWSDLLKLVGAVMIQHCVAKRKDW